MRVINGGLFVFAVPDAMGYIVVMALTTEMLWLRLFLWLLVVVLLIVLGSVILWLHFRKKREARGFEVEPGRDGRRR